MSTARFTKRLVIYYPAMLPKLITNRRSSPDAHNVNKMFIPIYFLSNKPTRFSLLTQHLKTIQPIEQRVLTLIGNFDKKNLTWDQKIEVPSDLKSVEGQKITIAYAFSKKIEYYSIKPKIKSGIFVDIFVIVCKKAKLKPSYKGVSFNHGTDDLMIINGMDKNFQLPSLILRKRNLKTYYYDNQQMQDTMQIVDTPIMESEYKMIITPAKSFNSYEKLILPFDKTTWFLLIATFCSAFGVVLLINLMRRTVQDLIYGADVRMAGFNIVQIFFGMGQMRLPNKWFPQLLLVLFITFCFIFRTAYQSVLFEFITTDMRKALPTSFQKLINQDYSFRVHSFDKTNDWEQAKLRETLLKFKK